MKDVDPASSSKPHAILLRVMRLIEPLPKKTNSSLVNHETNQEYVSTWDKEGVLCGVGRFSILPASFGAVYAAQVFRSLISLFNRTSKPAKILSLTVDLQTSSMQSIPLLKEQDETFLDSKKSLNRVVRVSLREVGTHVLTCSTVYEDAGTPRTLRQFFRFNVLPPNSPKQTANMLCQSLYHHPDPNYFTSSSYHALIELRIVNNTATTLYILGTKFMLRKPFQLYPCSRNDRPALKQGEGEGSNPSERTSRYATLNKGDVCAVTFQVHSNPKADNAGDDNTKSSNSIIDESSSNAEEGDLPYTVDSTAVSSPSLLTRKDPDIFTQHDFGALSVSWRSALGENGLLRTTLMMPEPKLQQNVVDVFITSVPRQIYVHRTFMARCQVRNNSDAPVRLYLQIRRDLVGEVVPVGVSGISLGSVSAGDKSSCAIPMIPLAKGVHSLSGIRVIDVETSAIYKARAAPVTVL